MIKTAVVILNWNGKNFLEKFLPLLEERTPGVSIVVADNASSDDSVAFVKDRFSEVQCIVLDQNYGFAGGYNKALSQISAEYYVLLNSDIEVDHNWLAPLEQFMDNNPDVAACQPKIMDFYHRQTFEYAGASGGFIDRHGFPFCRGRIFDTLEDDHGQYDDVTDVFWATGACMMVRADVYHLLGGLDADFFAHMEEIDFCWRLHNAGYRVAVVPSSKVFHIGGGTLPKKSSRKTFLNFRNNYLLLYKNLPYSHLFRVLTFRLFLDWIGAAKFLFQGNIGDFLAVFKAQRKTFFSFRKHKHKRKLNKDFTRKQSYKKSIVAQYHLKKKNRFSLLQKSDFFE